VNDLSSLISMIPVRDIARKIGVDENLAASAVAVAVPAIVAGLAANASSGGADSLENALGHHAGKSTDVDAVDEKDGEKIVANVFGAKKDEVVSAAAKKADGPDIGAIVAKVMPIIAPIVLAYVANQFMGAKAAPQAAPKPTAAPASSGNQLVDMLGGLIASPQAQDLIGGALSGLLGGGRK